MNAKRCTQCGIVKPFSEFYKDKRNKDGLIGCCKKCSVVFSRNYDKRNPTNAVDKVKRWIRNNRNKYLEYEKQRKRKAYYKNLEKSRLQGVINSNKRSASKKGNGGTFTVEEWIEIKNKYGNKCLRCGRSDVKLTMDHVTPISLGGRHEKENIQPLCKSCNSSKKATIYDYRQF